MRSIALCLLAAACDMGPVADPPASAPLDATLSDRPPLDATARDAALAILRDGEAPDAIAADSEPLDAPLDAPVSDAAVTDAQRPPADAAQPIDAAPPGPVGLEVELDGRLALATPLEPLTERCPAACDDADGDGLNDAFEDRLLEAWRPLIHLHPEEQLLGDQAAALGIVGRVALVQADPLLVRVFMMIGYSRDYGSCLGISGHDGDSERVVLELAGRPEAEGVSQGVVVRRAYTAAHEGTPADRSRRFEGASVGNQMRWAVDPESGLLRWALFSSKDKHASYLNEVLCAAGGLPCLTEICGSAETRLPPYVNAGEDDRRLVDDLAALGFPGDRAWADQPFCGGRGGADCSTAVREKLLRDPFD